MKKQLQGIALILFGILLMLVALIDPWIPIIDDIGSDIVLWLGVASGIAGLVFTFKQEKDK